MHLETRVLVTGGAGFLGSHLCERLLRDGARVICLDNFFTGAHRNIDHLKGHKGFELLRHDVTLPLFVEVDQIFNLACPASPIHYQHDPVQTTKTSVHGAINMLGLAKRLRARILQASTSEVYGDPDVHPQPEEYWGNVNPIGPRGVYDEAKRYAEAMTMAYHRQQGVDTSIARIFNTYGPRMRPNDGRAVPTFVRQAIADKLGGYEVFLCPKTGERGRRDALAIRRYHGEHRGERARRLSGAHLARRRLERCRARVSWSWSPGSSGRDVAEETAGSPKFLGDPDCPFAHVPHRRRQDRGHQTITVSRRGPGSSNGQGSCEGTFGAQ